MTHTFSQGQAEKNYMKITIRIAEPFLEQQCAAAEMLPTISLILSSATAFTSCSQNGQI